VGVSAGRGQECEGVRRRWVRSLRCSAGSGVGM